MTTKHTETSTAALDLDALEALARKATPGPYAAEYDGNGDCFTIFVGEWPLDMPVCYVAHTKNREANAAYLESIDPTTVLALIAHARAGKELRSKMLFNINRNYFSVDAALVREYDSAVKP